MLWFPFLSFIRTTGSPPSVMFVATAVVTSEAPVVASLFEKSLCKSLFCRRPQMSTLQGSNSAILWPMARSQAIKTQSELLQVRSTVI